jgi:hypothetical protein
MRSRKWKDRQLVQWTKEKEEKDKQKSTKLKPGWTHVLRKDYSSSCSTCSTCCVTLVINPAQFALKTGRKRVSVRCTEETTFFACRRSTINFKGVIGIFVSNFTKIFCWKLQDAFCFTFWIIHPKIFLSMKKQIMDNSMESMIRYFK